jgi:hypothetical protein
MSNGKKGPKKGNRPAIEDKELVSKNRRTNMAEAWAASVAEPEEPSLVATLPPLLVSEKTAGELLGVSRRQVFELNKAGLLPCVMIGCRKLYSVARLREFADGGTN